jgi:hypothetical protein
MSTIKTKYNLKQVVYNAYCSHEAYYVTCTDCNGTGYWEVAGKDMKIGCHTCNKESYWNTPGKIEHYKYFPCVKRLTIGQVRATIGHSPEIQYMCKETGLGSGALWREDSLTDDEAVANEAAKVLADRRNAGEDIKVDDLYIQGGAK